MPMNPPNRMPEKYRLGIPSEHGAVSRREVLGILSAVGAGIAVSQRSFAQNVAGGPRIVDTHHHIFPPKFTARNLKRTTDDSPTFPGSSVVRFRLRAVNLG